MRRLFVMCVLGVVVVESYTGLVEARGRSPQKNNNQQTKNEEVNLTGTIQSMASPGPGFVAYAKKAGSKKDPSKSWNVAAGDNMKVTVDGTATLDYLHLGQYLQFSAALDQTKEKDKVVDTVKGDVKEINIVSKTDHKPGVGSETEKKAKKDKAKDAVDTDPTPDVGGQDVKIIGKIQKIDAEDKHKITVAAGSHLLQIKLADDPSIKFLFTTEKDFKDEPKLFANVSGAKVSIHGMATESKSLNIVKADKVDITLIQPLTGKKKPLSTVLKTIPNKADADSTTPAAKPDDSDPASKTDDAKPDESKPDETKPEATKTDDK